jgi:pimeloyl-ACP methyl ester carboxylesterase
MFGLVALVTSHIHAQELDTTGQVWSDTSPHRVHSVPVASGVALEALDWGGEGFPLVFLAGLSMNAHAFDDFAPRFTDDHHVIGITRRGHGASTWPDSGYSTERRVEDLRLALDNLGLDQVIFAGHSLAGEEITRFATEYPERVVGLIYIDAGHDPTLLETLRIGEICPMGPEVMDAIERKFENPELVRHTQHRQSDDGKRLPYVSSAAMTEIIASETRPDYSGVRAPALAVYHVPKRPEDVVGGLSISVECASALQRYIYEGIALFAREMDNPRIVAIQDGQHNLHLVAADELESAMKAWLQGIEWMPSNKR